MSLKIKRELLEKIVLEELSEYIRKNLNEAPPGRGTVLDDEEPEEMDPTEELPDPLSSPEEALPSTSPAPEAGDEPGEPNDLPVDDEADDDLDAMLAGEEPPSEEEEGTVAGELKGKTIDNISVDEDSKIMPGATEIVVSFHDTPDALRFLISKTGNVKFFYRGLHNSLESMVSPVPDDDVPEEEMPGEEDESPEDFEDIEPLGDEDMPPEKPTEEPV